MVSGSAIGLLLCMKGWTGLKGYFQNESRDFQEVQKILPEVPVVDQSPHRSFKKFWVSSSMFQVYTCDFGKSFQGSMMRIFTGTKVSSVTETLSRDTGGSKGSERRFHNTT